MCRLSDYLRDCTNPQRPHNFWIDRFDPDNGANGMVPVYPREWALVGLDTDVKCFNLLKFLYGHCSNWQTHYGILNQQTARTSTAWINSRRLPFFILEKNK